LTNFCQIPTSAYYLDHVEPPPDGVLSPEAIDEAIESTARAAHGDGCGTASRRPRTWIRQPVRLAGTGGSSSTTSVPGGCQQHELRRSNGLILASNHYLRMRTTGPASSCASCDVTIRPAPAKHVSARAPPQGNQDARGAPSESAVSSVRTVPDVIASVVVQSGPPLQLLREAKLASLLEPVAPDLDRLEPVPRPAGRLLWVIFDNLPHIARDRSRADPRPATAFSAQARRPPATRTLPTTSQRAALLLISRPDPRRLQPQIDEYDAAWPWSTRWVELDLDERTRAGGLTCCTEAGRLPPGTERGQRQPWRPLGVAVPVGLVHVLKSRRDWTVWSRSTCRRTCRSRYSASACRRPDRRRLSGVFGPGWPLDPQSGGVRRSVHPFPQDRRGRSRYGTVEASAGSTSGRAVVSTAKEASRALRTTGSRCTCSLPSGLGPVRASARAGAYLDDIRCTGFPAADRRRPRCATARLRSRRPAWRGGVRGSSAELEWMLRTTDAPHPPMGTCPGTRPARRTPGAGRPPPARFGPQSAICLHDAVHADRLPELARRRQAVVDPRRVGMRACSSSTPPAARGAFAHREALREWERVALHRHRHVGIRQRAEFARPPRARRDLPLHVSAPTSRIVLTTSSRLARAWPLARADVSSPPG